MLEWDHWGAEVDDDWSFWPLDPVPPDAPPVGHEWRFDDDDLPQGSVPSSFQNSDEPQRQPEDAFPWDHEDVGDYGLQFILDDSDDAVGPNAGAAAAQPPGDPWSWDDEVVDAGLQFMLDDSDDAVGPNAVAQADPPPDTGPMFDGVDEDLDELVIDDYANVELDPIYSEPWFDEDESDDWWHALDWDFTPADAQGAAAPQPAAEEWRDDDQDDDLQAILDDADDAVGPDAAAAPVDQPPADAWPHDDDDPDDWALTEQADSGAASSDDPAAAIEQSEDDTDADDWWHGADASTPADVVIAQDQPQPEEWREDEPDDDWWLGLDAGTPADVAPPPPLALIDSWPHEQADDIAEDWDASDSAPVGADVVAAIGQPSDDAWPWLDDPGADDDLQSEPSPTQPDELQAPCEAFDEDTDSDDWWHDIGSSPVADAPVAGSTERLPAEEWREDEVDDDWPAIPAHLTPANVVPPPGLQPVDAWPWADEEVEDGWPATPTRDTIPPEPTQPPMPRPPITRQTGGVERAVQSGGTLRPKNSGGAERSNRPKPGR